MASSVKRNIFANYAAQAYVTVINIVMAPVYLSFMGTEPYGLIGFFTMMSAWFQLLDMGLSPTLAREAARFRGGATDARSLRMFLRALEVIFGSVSIAGAAVMILLANQIAAHWLNMTQLPVEQVAYAVMLMGLAVPLRWIAGLYRAVVNGFERQVWLGAYNMVIATARFVGVLVVFVTLGATPVHFFSYQLGVAAVEVCGLMIMTYRLVRGGTSRPDKFSWKPLAENLRFSLIIAFTATVSVVSTQTDKLILSKLLTLSDYGIFSLAVVAAGGISVLGGPFGQAILPNLTRLVAEGNDAEASGLYGHATQAVCILVAPAVTVLCFLAQPILRVWTGNPEIAQHAAPILRLYAIGNGWLALCSFPYYLQYAKGDLRLHFLGNALAFVLLVPLFVWSAGHYGAVGTGMVWATINGIYVLVWVPLIHRRVLKGEHWNWMKRDIFPIVVPTIMVGWLAAMLSPSPAGRIPALATIAVIGLLLVGVASSGSSVMRERLAMILKRRFGSLADFKKTG